MSEVPTGVNKDNKRVTPPFSGPLASFEAWLYEMVYVKVPFKLSKAAQDAIVQYGPWVILVIALLSLPTVFVLFGFGAVTSYYGATVEVIYSPMYYVALLALIVELVLLFMSISPLLKRQRKGWELVFYGATISVAYTLLNSFSYGYFAVAGLLWGLIGAAIGYYFLFQVRSHYKN